MHTEGTGCVDGRCTLRALAVGMEENVKHVHWGHWLWGWRRTSDMHTEGTGSVDGRERETCTPRALDVWMEENVKHAH